MSPNDIKFSVNDYDQDGDVLEKGIYLHFGMTRISVAENLEEFKKIVPHMQKIIKEIEENYS
jgi:hypothetical protein